METDEKPLAVMLRLEEVTIPGILFCFNMGIRSMEDAAGELLLFKLPQLFTHSSYDLRDVVVLV